MKCTISLDVLYYKFCNPLIAYSLPIKSMYHTQLHKGEVDHLLGCLQTGKLRVQYGVPIQKFILFIYEGLQVRCF